VLASEITVDGLSRETSPSMSQPHLKFACELDPERLTELFADGSVIANLQLFRRA
jgi:hypothetical protein